MSVGSDRSSGGASRRYQGADMTPRYRLLVGVVLLISGFLLLVSAIYAALNPVSRYELTLTPATAEAAKDAALYGAKFDALQSLEVVTPDARRTIAEALVARDASGRLTPLMWRNQVTEPVFFADQSAADLAKVVAAIREHVPRDAIVLAWWDLSRLLRLAAGRDAPLDDARATGLQTPVAWRAGAAQEAARWGAGVDLASTARFKQFVDALLMDESTGVPALKKLADGKPAFVVAHISDVWKIAAARPRKLAVAYKDFASTSVSHGVIKAAQQWMHDEKIEGGYAVEPMGSATRLHYFTRKSDGETLIARLLPFSTSLPAPLTQAELAWQHKGWWVWRLIDAPS